ncbi:MAG: DUF1801 domain-containing protein [Bacteroidales bacterium]|nr:DUF1801 domain-containing protein [Bacteroidales bacterium]
MAELKTKPTDQKAKEFLNTLENEQKRKDAFKLLNIMKEVTGEEPLMWGPSIIGFGSYHYKYASGREADWMLTGFSPRKNNLTVYIMQGFDKYDQYLAKIGKHKTGKSCLYLKSLDDLDLDVLKSLISESVEYMKNKKWE